MYAGCTLLESKVLPDRVYQKQEETLIVWTENESMDLALSFQEKSGCNDLWAKICDVCVLLSLQPVLFWAISVSLILN